MASDRARALLAVGLFALLSPVASLPASDFGVKEGVPIALSDAPHPIVPRLPEDLPKFVPPANPRVFCFCVVMPTLNEMKLLAPLQSSLGVCDGSAIISNVSSMVRPTGDGGAGETVAVERGIFGSMDVELGGEFGTALNTPVFNKVYAHLFSAEVWDRLQIGSYDWVRWACVSAP